MLTGKMMTLNTFMLIPYFNLYCKQETMEDKTAALKIIIKARVLLNCSFYLKNVACEISLRREIAIGKP